VTLVGRLFYARAAITRKERSPMVRSRVLNIRSVAVESRTVVAAATLFRQSVEDGGGGMEAPCCYGSGKRLRPVEIVFFPELATSGRPAEDV